MINWSWQKTSKLFTKSRYSCKEVSKMKKLKNKWNSLKPLRILIIWMMTFRKKNKNSMKSLRSIKSEKNKNLLSELISLKIGNRKNTLLNNKNGLMFFLIKLMIYSRLLEIKWNSFKQANRNQSSQYSFF
jgi:hypothetical protein